jgi:hypothetical protein
MKVRGSSQGYRSPTCSRLFSVAGPWLIVAVSLALFGCSGESGDARVQGSAAVRLQRHSTLLTELSRALDKSLWFLDAHLQR